MADQLAKESRPTALLVIDVQTALTDGECGDPRPFNRDDMLTNIQTLLANARDAGAKVIYIQHREDQNPAMSPGHPGFEVEKSIAPLAGETALQKTVGDSFSNPELAPTLRELGVTNVAVCGMQSDMCVQATTRGAIANGFNVTLASDAHATYDTDEMTAPQIITHINQTLGSLKGPQTRVTPVHTANIAFAAAGATG
jgi:nicotinamidase-related amidase